MDHPDTAFSELVNSLKSWIPRRSEPANVSRDFWMPDHSCRVCYDCDSQFTIFNRRHHCRRCGRIFCGRCTANSVPVLADDSRDSREDVERIRVCNFCFKQWEQEIFAADKGSQASDSPSLSEMSFVSTKSNGTVNSSTTTAGSYSTGACQHSSLGSVPSPHQSCHIKSFSYKKEHVSGRNGAAFPEKDASSSIQFGYLTNRSDDDGEEYAAFHDLQAQNIQHPDCYYSQVEFDELDAGYTSQIMNTVEENVTTQEICSPLDDTEFQDSLADHKLEDGAEPDNSYECDASSSIYAMEGTDTEPVDFENNGLLWLPPDPEDEDDEREPNLFDDDDEDATGDWDRLCSSHSFGSCEYRSRDRSSEEHKKAMKNVVDGHFRALIAQLLQVENISICEEGDKMCWLEIITSLSWEAANFLKPDMSKGGGMDPGGYVKVKCLACGHRSESMVVKGIVCKKNTAHRRMTSRIEKPRFLILGGALEYQRVTNLLSSIDTLLQQETDHLRMAVAKIVAHQPDILFVEKTVARYAQDLLLEKDISLVLNIKRPLLERIARCSGAQIAPSIDHLSSQKLGHCELFHVEKFFEHHESAGQGMKKMLKTLMFLEGCPKPLGCTVLLKGGTIDELKRVKHVIQYGIFAAYHLALETSFLADEGASLPELPLKSPITVALPDKPSSIDKSISTIPGFTLPAAGKQQATIDAQKPNISDSNLTSIRSTGVLAEVMTSSSRSHSSSTAKSASASTDLFVDTNLNSFCPAKLSNSSPLYGTMKEKSKVCFGDFHETVLSISDGQAIAHDSVIPDSCHNCWKISESDGFPANGKHSESNNSDQEVDRKHENTLLKEEILTSSSDHQSILVSLSTRCVWKGTVCERSQLFRIKYYSNFDKPLGRFLRDHLFDQSYQCCSCEMPSEAHVHCYTHHQGSLTISVRKLPEFLLPGERDGKIWMWHRCLRCPRDNGFPPATQRVVMSDAAWGLSFGKFLELSFSNHAAASRVASCGHSLHRDCLRFYGFGKMVACFRYASIDVHSVYLPPHKLDFDHKNHEWIQKEADEVSERAELLFREIQNALYQIADKRTPKGSSEVSELGHYIVDLEGILQKEKSEFEDSMHKILKKELRMGQQIIDILEVNKLRRQLLFHSYLWDQRLIFASRPASSPQEVLNSSPQRDKDKNYSTENADKMSNPQTDIHGTDAVPEDLKTSNLRESINAVNSEEVFHDNHKSNLGQQGVDIELDSFQMKESNMSLHTSTSVSEQSVPLEYGLVARRTLSDGHFPNIPNLSYAFDAKWTGENGPLIANASTLDSSASVEAPAPLALSEDSEEQNGAEVTHSFASVLLSKLGDSAEDFSSWLGMPFVHFYRSLNKGWGGSHRFGALNEYTPVYVSLFRELERQGGPRFLLPVGVNDIVIAIYDDEPTSIISYALVSHEYHIQLSDNQERIRDVDASLLTLNDSGVFLSSQSVDEISSDPYRNFGSNDDSILSLSGSRSSFAPDPLISTKAMHVRVSFTDEGPLGKVKYTVTCYYAKHFDTLRRTCCPSEVDFVRSLSRCKKWGAQGGKSNVFFAKSLDDRFIIKQVTKTELESFIKFAPAYFKYLAESIGTRSPTCLAKILGIYQVTAKNLKGGKELKMDVLVMENLLFGRNVTRLYDLKGSSRSRYNPDSSGSNKVLLDQNLIETMPTSPIFVGNKAKRLLERAVWNDTSFLASIDVMDYSLLVGIDEEKHELVLGIIDFMRQYTWDKHLETWVKASGILGGPKNVSPTVISPKQYKKRFRKAMSAYFLVVPDQWSPPASMPSKSTAESGQDILQDSSGGS